MIKCNQKILEESTSNTLATSPLAIAGGEAGAFREAESLKLINRHRTSISSLMFGLVVPTFSSLIGPSAQKVVIDSNESSCLCIKKD